MARPTPAAWASGGRLASTVQFGHFAVQSSVLFAQKGYGISGYLPSLDVPRTYDEQLRLNYLTVPLNLAFTLGKNGQVSLSYLVGEGWVSPNALSVTVTPRSPRGLFYIRPMKHCLLVLCLLALPALTYAQRVANPRLKHELDSLYYVDQVYREAMFGEKKQHLMDSIAAARHFPVAEASQRLVGLMLQTDSADMRRVRALIRRYGYPGKKLVGTPTNEAAFYVIQHSNSIPQYLPLIKQAADQGELPFRLYAMMLDRHLMGLGKPQVYGTQGRSYSGQPAFIWPIEDPAHVNERRKKAGFELSVEDNAKRLDIPYQVLTMEEVRKMPNYQPPAH